MVSIEPYGTKIEEIFYFSVEKQFSKAEKTEIVNGCKKFFPLDFFVTGQDFKQLVLAPYSELKRVYEYIKQDENPMLQECFPLNANGKREIKEKYKKFPTAMQGLGYKEILAYLNGTSTLEEAIYIIKRESRHFAKRQLTWFRRERDVIWLNKPDFEYDDTKILTYMMDVLQAKGILPA